MTVDSAGFSSHADITPIGNDNSSPDDLVSLQDRPTVLLEWISEYAAVRAYTTADSAVSYLNHARVA